MRNISSSIVICTHNRAELAAEAVRAVLATDLDPALDELIVVDSASTDATQSAVAAALEGARVPARCVREPLPGLSCARNRGVAEARGDIVLFLDDDARPRTQDWAATIAAAFEDPRVAAAGGDTPAVWPDGERPAWLSRRLDYFFGVTSRTTRRRTVSRYPTFPWGANLAFRRDRLIAAGGFSADLGRVGTNLASAEEAELCLRLQQSGYIVVTVPEAAVDHLIDPARLDMAWMERRALASGRSRALLERRNLPAYRIATEALTRLALAAGAPAAAALARLAGLERTRVLMEMQAIIARAYIAEILRGWQSQRIAPGPADLGGNLSGQG